MALSREELQIRLNAWRIIFALQIVIGHVVRFEETIINLFGRFMIVSVAFFFFVSAFGMVNSYKNKENYLDRFMIRKPIYLLAVAMLFCVINYVLDIYFDVNMMLSYRMTPHALFMSINWYIWSLILHYIIFYFVFKYIKSDKVKMLIFSVYGMVLVYFSYLYLFEGWYMSQSGFILGMVFGLYYEKIVELCNGVRILLLGILSCCIGLLAFILTGTGFFEMVVLRNIMCLGVLLMLIWLCQYIDLDNKIMRFLSGYTTEIYLSQFGFLYISRNMDWTLGIRLVFVFFMTIILAVITHPLIKLMRRWMW